MEIILPLATFCTANTSYSSVSASSFQKKELVEEEKTLSVHSTPNAVSAYQKLGFQAKSEEQNINGIRFVTMEKSIL